jgi:L-asparaginase/Glu-tRNA(Gln) amidotransferase subunit D
MLQVALRSIPSPSTQGGRGGRLVTIDEGSYDDSRSLVASKHKRHLMMLNSMPRVLLVHTGGTLGMDPQVTHDPTLRIRVH